MTLPVSRSLLFPGPQPPLSHFGVTLLRHTLATGLRYSLYQLGLAPPDKAPVRIVALRLYLDGAALAEQSTGDGATGTPATSAAHREVFAALISPEGAAETSWRRSSLGGSVLFHRTRLRLPRRRAATPAATHGKSAQQLWKRFRADLHAELPRLQDALLGEILSAMARRRRRANGTTVEPCLGHDAWRLRAGKRPRLSRLGPPDLFQPSWASAPETAERARTACVGQTLPPRHPLRGAFRETWRAGLDRLRVPFLALAEAATANGLLNAPEDAFFLPFDLGHELTADTPAAWLPDAVAANRREYEAQLDRPSPPQVVRQQTVALGRAGGPGEWITGPLSPLE